MKARCLNPKATAYRYYGGRGITIAAEWVKSFAKFFAHIGPAPSPTHTVDRIDNFNGYMPGNVRWATKVEQARNRRIVMVGYTTEF